jgi:hypothetical protein
MPANNLRGVLSNLLSTSKAILLLKPVSIIAAARMKAPRIKNTAELPNRAKASLLGITPSRGRRAITNRPVTERGSAFVIHRIIAHAKIPIAFFASVDSPVGAGDNTKTASTSNEKAMTIYCPFLFIIIDGSK